MEAKLEKSGFFSFNDTRKHGVIIKGVLDINQLPARYNPATVSNSKEFGMLCCVSGGPLSTTVNIPRTGYAPGEDILVSAEIENMSEKMMNRHKVNLLQHMIYKSDYGKRKIVEIMVQVHSNSLLFNILLLYINIYLP